MAIAHVVLGALLAGDANGYRVWMRITARPVGGRRLESSRVYEALAELERAGHVSGRDAARGDGLATREFALTADGRAELDGWLVAPVRMGEWRTQLLAKVALSSADDDARGLAADLESRRRALRRLDEPTRATRGRANADGDGALARLSRLARERSRCQLAIEIAMLEAALSLVRDGAS